jgi:hypothetical protein
MEKLRNAAINCVIVHCLLGGALFERLLRRVIPSDKNGTKRENPMR